MRRDSSRPGPGRWAVPVVLLAVLVACGAEQIIEPPPPGGNGNPPDPSVAGYIGGLPSWSTFAPDTVPEQNPTATSTPPVALPDTVVTDTLGDDGSTRYPIPPVTYACQIQEYSMAKTPREIVMYSPDTDILWPGALIQGKSHKDPLGSLLGLTISQRTPFARPRARISSSTPNSLSSTATITLPQISYRTPSSRQNRSMASFPSRQLAALREPGR